MSESEYWSRVRGLVRAGDDEGRPKSDVSAEIVHLVEAAEQSGEHWAYETLSRWIEQGASRDYTAVHKDMHSVTYIRRNGQRVKKTVSYSRPKRSDEDGQIVGRQMQAFWDMGIDEVTVLRQEVADQRGRLSDVVSGLDRLLDTMRRHPGATAGEAWTREGHSLDEINLGEVAA